MNLIVFWTAILKLKFHASSLVFWAHLQSCAHLLTMEVISGQGRMTMGTYRNARTTLRCCSGICSQYIHRRFLLPLHRDKHCPSGLQYALMVGAANWDLTHDLCAEGSLSNDLQLPLLDWFSLKTGMSCKRMGLKQVPACSSLVPVDHHSEKIQGR